MEVMKMQLRIIFLSFLLLVLSGCWTDDPTRHNTFIPITAMEVTATYESMADQTVNQYKAVGDFSGAFTRDITAEVTWIIEDDAIAAVSNDRGHEGLVTAISPGETVITAMYEDLFMSAPVVVTSAFLTGIEIAPQDVELKAGITQQYEAAGTFSDDSNQDVTMLATWESSNTDVATIDSLGLATTVDAGTSTISGAWQGIVSSTSLTVVGATLTAITITPQEATIAQGTTVQFEAEGTYSDNTTLPITDIVDWHSSAASIGDVSSEGLATGIAPGEIEISASFDVDGKTISATAVLTVTNAVIVSIRVTPENSIMQQGTSQQFSATGRFSDSREQDITDVVSWLTTDNSVGSISNFSDSRGLFTSNAAGTTFIVATFEGISGETPLRVQ
jgi:hypothetical protein